jgi:hypothetical protein
MKNDGIRDMTDGDEYPIARKITDFTSLEISEPHPSHAFVGSGFSVHFLNYGIP